MNSNFSFNESINKKPNFFSVEGLSCALQSSFGIDRRSLSLFRVLVGLTIIGDLWDRSRDLDTFYTDNGIIPRPLAMSSLGGSGAWFDVYLMSGAEFWVSLLFLVHAFFSFMMTIGYYTRLFTVLTFIMTHSIIFRVIPLVHGGDLYLNCLLFISIFLPTGDYYSVDALLSNENTESFFFDLRPPGPNFNSEEEQSSRRGKPFEFLQLLRESLIRNSKDSNLTRTESTRNILTRNIILNMTTVLTMYQVFALYYYAHYMKTGKPWTNDFTAAFYALKLDYFRMPLGDFFLNFPLALKFLTWAVKKWQFWGAIFLILPLPSPVHQQYLRLFGCCGFFAMHLAFGLCLRLGTFFWISMAGVFLILPPVFWDDILFPLLSGYSRSPFPTSKVIIQYPQNCKKAQTTKKILQTFFLPPSSIVEPYYANGSHKNDHNWIFVDEYGQKLRGLNAWIRIFKLSPILFVFGWILSFSFVFQWTQFICEKIENWDRNNARKESKDVERGINYLNSEYPSSQKNRKQMKFSKVYKFFQSLLICIASFMFLWFIFYSNENSIGRFGSLKISSPPLFVAKFSSHMDLNQRWSMFAPQPPNSHWYYVMEGTLKSNNMVDLWKKENLFKWEGGNDWKNNQTIDWGQPDPFAYSVGNHRWFKFYENGINLQSRNRVLLPSFGNWICRRWNDKYGHNGPNRLNSMKIWILQQRQNLDGTRESPSKDLLWHHICGY